MAELRVSQLMGYPPSCATWILTAFLSFLTMCIAYFAKSGALACSVASVTLLVAYCPSRQCCQDGDSCKVLCIFIIVLFIIEWTGFVVPLIIHGVTAYLLVKETYTVFQSMPEETADVKPEKGPIVAATVFSILATLGVAVMAYFWCFKTRSPAEIERELERQCEVREAERLKREQEELERIAKLAEFRPLLLNFQDAEREKDPFFVSACPSYSTV